MIITDEAIILKIQKFQEKGHIISCLSKEHGIIKGLSRGSLSAKNRPEYFPGNIVQATWKARLLNQLGQLTIENKNNIVSAIHNSYLKLTILNSALILSECILQEHDPQEDIYEKLKACLVGLMLSDIKVIMQNYIELELEILKRSGYGVDLTKCAVSKETYNLKYVSPKSGCAISENIGKAYHDKLLILPEFLINQNVTISADDILSAMKLTGYFLNKHIFLAQNQNVPLARTMLGEKIEEHLKQVTYR